MKTIVFFFVPVYCDQQSTGSAFHTDTRAALRKTRCIFFERHRQIPDTELSFWTWFDDNPRPSIALNQRQ